MHSFRKLISNVRLITATYVIQFQYHEFLSGLISLPCRSFTAVHLEKNGMYILMYIVSSPYLTISKELVSNLVSFVSIVKEALYTCVS